MSVEQLYEYVAVTIKGLAPNEVQITDQLNAVAEHGWRLVEFIPTTGKIGVGTAVFERLKS